MVLDHGRGDFLVKAHPVASIFPAMGEAEYAALKADIKANGQREAIWTWQGQIIDGRHRDRACSELGVPCQAREHQGEESGLVGFVVSLNLHRRHLNESQRAVVAARIATLPQGPNRVTGKSAGVSQEEASALLNVSDRSIRDVKRLEREAPELLPKVEAGELSLNAAVGEIKKRERVVAITSQRDELARARPEAPLGLFNVIAIDPPWPYGEEIDVTGYDAIGHRASNPYPEMALEDITAIKPPAAADCVLWLWTTHRFMRHAFPILDVWGFEDKAIVTWAKDRMGLGRWLRSQSEFCIMAVKGKPPITLTNQTTIVTGPMREHSRKPDEFYAMVDSLCHGRKLDYFSREKREGWEQFGNDVEKFAA
jgi:N6-adenosine-specific RNA methylase IME4